MTDTKVEVQLNFMIDFSKKDLERSVEFLTPDTIAMRSVYGYSFQEEMLLEYTFIPFGRRSLTKQKQFSAKII